MIKPIRDSVIDTIRANVNAVSNLSERLIKIARLRDALDTLTKETEALKPIEFPLWVMSNDRGRYTSQLWIRSDVSEEIHAIAVEYTHTKQPWGVDDCGNAANPAVPYMVYLVDSSTADLCRKLRSLIGEPGQMIPGMGATHSAYISKVLKDATKRDTHA